MLRILQITPYYADAWAYGGIPRAVAALSGALARRGHRVSVFTTDACDASGRLGATASGDHGGVTVRAFRNRSNHLAYHWQVFSPIGLRGELRREVARFDVVHVHAHRHALEWHAANACLAADVPFVLTPNGTAPRIERRRLAKFIFDATAGNRVLRQAAFVTAVSEAERRQLEALRLEADRIRLLPNALDLAEFDVPASRSADPLSRTPTPLVLFLGKLTPRKGADVLVRAFAQLDADARLAIAGNDMGSAAGVRSLARRLGVDSRVTWPGLLRGADRLRALAAADLVVYPSRDEVFGLVAFEAILCGTPVIVGDDCGCGEIVSALGGGATVPPGDASALAQRMRNILLHREAWRARVGAAAERVRAVFGSDRVAATAETIYLEARARARGAAA